MLSRSIALALCKRGRLPERAAPAFVQIARLSASGTKKAPDEFYHEELETEKEMLEITSTLANGDLLDITSPRKATPSWEELQKLQQMDIHMPKLSDVEGMDSTTEEARALVKKFFDKSRSFSKNTLVNSDLANHISSFEDSRQSLPQVLPHRMLNYNVEWRTQTEFPDKMLQNFVQDTDSIKYRFDGQGNRACPGKLQRRGKSGKLGCHKVDLDALNHLDVMTLRNFVSVEGEILGRKVSGLCARCQRKVAKTIKRSRCLGILPHLGHFEIQTSPMAQYERKLDKPEEVKISKVIFNK